MPVETTSRILWCKERVARYITLVKDIPNTRLYASIDSWGGQAEYIRHGLEISHFEENLHRILGNGIEVGIMCTFNLLSIPGVETFLFKMAELKNVYGDLVTIDMHYMVEPAHLSAQLCGDNHISIMENSLKNMESYPFSPAEIAKYRKTVEWIKAHRFTGDKLQREREDFWKFVNEHDRRRNTDFTQHFGEKEVFFKST